MKMLARVLAAVVALVALVLVDPGVARAAPLHDADAFSIDLSAARVCFIVPRELRDAAACEGLDVNVGPFPSQEGAAILAVGFVRLPGRAQLAMVTVHRLDHGLGALTEASSREIAKGIADGVRGKLPPSATVHPPTGVRIEHVGNVDAARAVIDVDGAPEPLASLLAHQVHYTIPAAGPTYSISWTTSRSASASDLDSVASAALQTVKLAHPPRSSAFRAGYLVGQVGGLVVVLVVALVAVVVGTRKKRVVMSPAAGAAPGSGWGAR